MSCRVHLHPERRARREAHRPCHVQRAVGRGHAWRHDRSRKRRHPRHRPRTAQRRPALHRHPRRRGQRAVGHQGPRHHVRRPGVGLRPAQDQRPRADLRQVAHAGDLPGDRHGPRPAVDDRIALLREADRVRQGQVARKRQGRALVQAQGARAQGLGMPDLQRARLHRGAPGEAVRPGEHERSPIGLAQAARAGQGRRDRRHRRCTRLRPVAHAHLRRGARQSERVALDRVAARRKLHAPGGHGARARIHRDLARRASEDRDRPIRRRGRGPALGVRPGRASAPGTVAAFPERRRPRLHEQAHRLGRLVALHRQVLVVDAAADRAHGKAVARGCAGVADQSVQAAAEAPRRAAHVQRPAQAQVALHREQRRRACAPAERCHEVRARRQRQVPCGQRLTLDSRQGAPRSHRDGAHCPGAAQRRPGRHRHRTGQRPAHGQRARRHGRRACVEVRSRQGQRARALLHQRART
ncbi:hypothetical protein KHHGKMAE_3851 [Methylobacterium persicinum]|nr:hypothetical protein KHHGKMAE_3851 [Methylobacterium persicinum]